jgi:hypothetical protein
MLNVAALRWQGSAALGAIAIVATGGLPMRAAPLLGAGGVAAPRQAQTVAAFHQIIPPDLMVIEPAGLDTASLVRLAKIHGVKDLLAFDGARIGVGGHRVNVIGVNAQRFRSWTPLSTASRQQLWSTLAIGGFVTSPSLAHKLRLHVGTRYTLTGAGPASLRFAGAAPLGLPGIGAVVSNRASATLGLIHDVAAFISAPSVATTRLHREVRAALHGTGTVIILRQQLPVDRGTGGRPTTYLQLFHESAARYCPGLSWTVLAAIGQIESGDGTNNGPSPAGALGPMQFMPATWKVWGITAYGEPGPPNIMDAYDAVPSAARYLCAAGAGTPAGLPGAIFAYNHANWYVAEVLALAKEYAQAYG